MLLKMIVKRAYLCVSFPLRWLIRHELAARRPAPALNDIGASMQRLATESSARYACAHFAAVDSDSSDLDLLSRAFGLANTTNDRLICEFGVFRGRTINHIAALTSRTVYGFDSFEGLPDRWRDGFGAGAFAVSKLPIVRHNVELVVGRFDASIPDFLNKTVGLVGYLHIDCDLYSSTKIVFDLLASRIMPGCVIVFDEYFNFPGWERGEFRAFQEFLHETGHSYEYIGFNRLHEQVAVRITG